MRDVAREAGVAVGTVSRVMNNEPGVKPKSRSLVQEAAARLGWKPNSIAASMRTSSTRTIGCVFSDIRNPLFAAIERAAETLLREHGYTLIVANSNDDIDLEKKILELMLRRRIDGLIFSPARESDPSNINMLIAADVPVVAPNVLHSLATGSFSVRSRASLDNFSTTFSANSGGYFPTPVENRI